MCGNIKKMLTKITLQSTVLVLNKGASMKSVNQNRDDLMQSNSVFGSMLVRYDALFFKINSFNNFNLLLTLSLSRLV